MAHNSRRAPLAVLLLAASLVLVLASVAAARPAKTRTEVVKLVVKSDTEHAKKGSDGKWHDAFLPASFTVHAGDRVVVHVLNYDPSAHSFNAAGLHLNAVILPGSAKTPKETTFSFRATKKGIYRWHCDPKCDPWAMAHNGFMRGQIKII